MNKTLDALIRDLTKIHPQPKSYVRKLLVEYHEGLIKEIEEATVVLTDAGTKPKDGYGAGWNDGWDNTIRIVIDLINNKLK